MKYAVLQISRGSIHLIIREQSDLVCWEKRTFTPPKRMLLESSTIQDILDLIEEMIEIARLQGVPVWDLYACMDLGMSTILNVNAILTRSKSELALPIHVLKQDEEALWGWMGKRLGLSLREGATAWIDISHNALFCVLGEQQQIHQTERIQWSLLERTTHYWGKVPDRLTSQEVSNVQTNIQDRLRSLHWKKRPHNLIVTGYPVQILQQLFPLESNGSHHGTSLSRATLRQWIDHLSSSTRKHRLRLIQDEAWADGILTTALLLLELCNTSFKDSFIMSDGVLAFGILASIPTNTP